MYGSLMASNGQSAWEICIGPGRDEQLPGSGSAEEIVCQSKEEPCAQYHVGRHHNLSLNFLRPKRSFSYQSIGQSAPYR